MNDTLGNDFHCIKKSRTLAKCCLIRSSEQCKFREFPSVKNENETTDKCLEILHIVNIKINK